MPLLVQQRLPRRRSGECKQTPVFASRNATSRSIFSPIVPFRICIKTITFISTTISIFTFSYSVPYPRYREWFFLWGYLAANLASVASRDLLAGTRLDNDGGRGGEVGKLVFVRHVWPRAWPCGSGTSAEREFLSWSLGFCCVT